MTVFLQKSRSRVQNDDSRSRQGKSVEIIEKFADTFLFPQINTSQLREEYYKSNIEGRSLLTLFKNIIYGKDHIA
jgi:hypothetical protein